MATRNKRVREWKKKEWYDYKLPFYRTHLETGAAMKELRSFGGVTQAEMADSLGLSLTTISKLEAGGCAWSPDRVTRWRAAVRRLCAQKIRLLKVVA